MDYIYKLINSLEDDYRLVKTPQAKTAINAEIGRWYDIIALENNHVKISDDVKDLIISGKKIEAIKKIREKYSCSLWLAKETVDKYMKDNH